MKTDKPIEKTLFIRSGVAMLLLLAGAFIQNAVAQATVNNFQFKQYDRYSDGGSLLFANSSLGYIAFVQNAEPRVTWYLNIYAQRPAGGQAWLVRNFPVSGSGATVQHVEVDYKLLGVVPGQAISFVNMSHTLTRLVVRTTVAAVDAGKKQADDGKLLSAAFSSFRDLITADGMAVNPTVASEVPVGKQQYRNEASHIYSEERDYAVFKLETPLTQDPVHHKVPSLQEDDKMCLPGSFARSIAWLNDTYKLGYKGDVTEIYKTLRDKMEANCTRGTPDYNQCRVAVKSEFLKGLSGGKGKTTVTVVDPDSTFKPKGVPAEPTPADPLGWIGDKLKDCDVEVAYTYAGGGGHIFTVTKIQCNAKECVITYRDDEHQGNNSSGDTGEKTVTILKGKDTFSVNGTTCKLWYMVSECIEPGPQRTNTAEAPITLLQNSPNPFGGSTNIGVRVQEGVKIGTARLIIRNSYGNEVQRIRLNLQPGLNNIPYQPGKDAKGLLYYSLQVDGQVVATRQMMTELQAPQLEPWP